MGSGAGFPGFLAGELGTEAVLVRWEPAVTVKSMQLEP